MAGAKATSSAPAGGQQYERLRRKERCRAVRQASRSRCVVVWAQAGMPVLLNGKFKGAGRRPAVRKAKAKRTMSRCAPSIAITLRCRVGRGRNACATERLCCPRTAVIFTSRLSADACATERRTSKRNAACYDFGLVARGLLTTVMGTLSRVPRNVAQPASAAANPSDGPLKTSPGGCVGRRWTLPETGHRNGE
jgi:hypothetical protein